MKNFCDKCQENLGAYECKEKRCGKCCSDKSCCRHSHKFGCTKSSKISIDYDSDYDSDFEYDRVIIDELTKIIYDTCSISDVLIDMIVEYIDNSPICCICEYYCQPNPYRCKNCGNYMCEDCSKCVYTSCYDTDCYYCRSGKCFNNMIDEYCKKCYPKFAKKCSKCKKYNETFFGLDECSECNRYFCSDCGEFERIYSKCYETNCRYCEKGDCYNVRLISNKCVLCYDYVDSENDSGNENDSENEECLN